MRPKLLVQLSWICVQVLRSPT